MENSQKQIGDNISVVFENFNIRKYYDEKHELWYFSVIDVVAVLIEQTDYKKAKSYWTTLKNRLKTEGSEVVTFCDHLKMIAQDGKLRETDVATVETLLRLIQSVPSPKAEPIKLWLAKVGYERLEETEDPELSIDRVMKNYLQKGYSKEWINQRLKTIEVCKELTDEWQTRGVKEGQEYAVLTDEMTNEWAGMKVKDYKRFKGLKKQSLRDNMTNLELVLNMLAEATTTEISKKKLPDGFSESCEIAKQGGRIAGDARRGIERETGVPVVSRENAKNFLMEAEEKRKLSGH
ncbi:MAG: BRO family protein [Candidatus Peregrinibacteria bacterium]|nr:BRO family protein [Candidatus Peregrinibacteria bacterium]